jgi:RHS repeat-associated protein
LFKFLSIFIVSALLISTPHTSALAAVLIATETSTEDIVEPVEVVHKDPVKLTQEKLETITLSFDKINETLSKVNLTANIDKLPLETPLEIVDANTFEVLKTCLTVSSCSLDVDITKHTSIIARAGNVSSNVLVFNEEDNTSRRTNSENQTNARAAARSIRLTTDIDFSKTPFSTTGNFDTSGSTFMLAESNADLDGTGYQLFIIDRTLNQGEACVTTVQCEFINEFKTGGPHTYQAFIANEKTTPGIEVTYEDLVNIQASSNTVSYSRLPFIIEPFINSVDGGFGSEYEGGNGYATTIQTANHQSTSPDTTPYRQIINNASTNEWNVENVALDYPEDMGYITFNGYKAPQNIIAYVGIPIFSPTNPSKVIGVTDIQARSSTMVGYDNVTTIGANGSGLQKGGLNPSENCDQGCAADPINTFSGEFHETIPDLENISGTSAPLGFNRTYSSLNSNINGPLGYGWTHNYDMKLSPYNMGTTNATTLSGAPAIEVKQENGATSYFTKTTDGAYLSFDKTHATLTYDAANNQYVFVRNATATYIFDSTGKLISITDLNNNSIDLTYNTAGKLTTITNEANQNITITWTDTRVTKVKNSANKEVVYTYNTTGDLTNVNDVMGGNTVYTYITDHRISQMKRPNGGIVKNTYNTGTTEQKRTVASQTDELGNITTITNARNNNNESIIVLPDGSETYETYVNGRMSSLTKYSAFNGETRTWEYSYDEGGNLAQTINPDNSSVENTYDSKGNILTTTNELNKTTKFEYNHLKQVTKIIDPLNREVNLTYSPTGNLLTSTDSKGNVTKLTYNAQGQKTSVISPLLHTTTFEYDANGFLNKTINPSGEEITSINNNYGLPTSVTDANLNTTTVSYNNLGQPLVKLDPSGATTSYVYDISGNLLSVTDAKGKVSSLEYNLKNNVTKSTDPNLNFSTVEYDSRDNPVSSTDARGNTATSVYNGFGNVIESTNALGKITKFTYNWRDQITITTLPTGKKYTTVYNLDGTVKNEKNPQNFTTAYTYNNAGETITVKDPLLNVTTFEYDANGQVSKVIRPDTKTQETTYDTEGKKDTYKDEAGNIANYDYNANGQLITTSEYGVGTELEYDPAGNLTKKINPADDSYTAYVYNSRNLLTKIDYSDATTDINYSYNNLGQRSTMVDSNGTTSYTYDDLGRTTRVANTVDGNIDYTYDANSNLATLKTPSGKTATYTYDVANNLTKVNEAAMGNVSYTYNNDNLLSTTTFANTLKTTNTYNASNLLTGMVTKKGTATATLLNYSYTYNNNSLIASQNTATATITDTKSYSYDSLLRMNTVTTGTVAKTFGFDDIHNIISKPNGDALSYNADNQLTSMTNTATGLDFDYSYDARGNRIEKESTVGTTTNTVAGYGYNIANQLTEANLSANPPNTTEIDYSYNGEGLRNKKTKTAGTTVTNEKYIWNSESSIPVLLEDKDYTYVYGLGSAPIAQIKKGTNVVTYLHSDQIGSVKATSNATGAITEQYLYDEYGNITGGATSHTATLFGFAGEYLDTDTGFYYLRARWYDPQTAQFTTVDPALITTHLVYGYTAGNPLSYTDPLGLDWLSQWASDNMEELQNTSDWVAGFGDTLTTIPFTEITITQVVRRIFDPNSDNAINKCSDFYIWGGLGGAVAAVGLGGPKAITSGSRIKGEIKILTEMNKAKKAPYTQAGNKRNAGDNVLSNTPAGNFPSWSAQKQRYWKNQYASPDRKWNTAQMDRMRRGLAPQRNNPDKPTNGGIESMELSHEPIPQRDGGTAFAMRWPPDHARVDSFRNLGYNSKNYGTGKPN